ncbi:MAG: alpha/beta fold hydrolase [Deltaproteobacteria bacterium]|nr:alpha/beta fold hydrolase [Deltaproteobacteria bacterium]
MQLHHEVQGEGRPLIIIHGLFGSLENWRTQSKNLSRFFRVYTLDLRNHGKSPHSDVFSYPAMAEDLRDFLAAQELPSAFIMGHSMGGKVAIQFGMDHPDKVDKLVIVDVALKTYRPEYKPILGALLSLDLREFHTRADVDSALQEKIPEGRLRRFLLKSLARAPEGGFRWRINLNAIYKNDGELSKAVEQKRRFAKPACFIKAGRSNYLDKEDVAAIKKAFPKAEVITVPDAGHWIHVDAPEEFTRIVVDFLSR